jgi:hypothetical protein
MANKNFRDTVRANKIKTPSQRGFELDRWNKAFEDCKSSDPNDVKLYEASLAFHSVFSNLRTELELLYKKSTPNITNSELLKHYCAISNRDRAVIGKYGKSAENVKQRNFSSVTIDANLMKNELTLSEVADGCVDMFQKAISSCVERFSQDKPLRIGSDPLGVMEFIQHETHISQLYSMYEYFWNALLWEEYEFSWLNKAEQIAQISQPDNQNQVAFEVSKLRKARLSAGTIAHLDAFTHYFADDSFLEVKGAGKKRELKICKIKNSTKQIAHINALFRIHSMEAIEHFPESFANVKSSAAPFSIMEVLDVFRILMLLANEFSERFPKDDSAYTSKKLLQFCPVLSLQELCLKICKALNQDFPRVLEILNFLTHKKSKDDLWCHPLLRTGDGKICLMVSALLMPNILRVIEHWLVSLNIALDGKGYHYEGNLISKINAIAKSNRILTDYNEGTSRRFKLKTGEEEIDFLMRIGNIVILGEAKSIVTSDSPISRHNTLQTLEHAANQARRKKAFVESNIAQIMEILKWKCDSKLEIIPIIINSNKIYSGFSIFGVPVCDEVILTAYFEKSDFPIFSVSEKGIVKHLAWSEVYKDFSELQLHLGKYLATPPQIRENRNTLEFKNILVPGIGASSLKVVFSRLVPKDISLIDRLKMGTSFRMRTVDDLEEILKTIDVVL